MRVSVIISGLDEFRRDVERLRDRMRNIRPLAKKIASRLRACFAENFNAEGRPEKWAPLAESTIAQKQGLWEAGFIRGRRRGIRVRPGPDIGGMPGILMKTGALKDSVARAHTRGNIERIRDGGKEVEVGTSLPYAAVHEFGGEGSYTITPRGGKCLAFIGIDRRTGQPAMIFTRGPVKHPPMKRRSFLVVTEDTWDLIQEDALEYLAMADRGTNVTTSDN
jgi:phage gpG-like protein